MLYIYIYIYIYIRVVIYNHHSGGNQARAAPRIIVLLSNAQWPISAGALDKVRAVQQLDTCDVEAALVLYARLLAEVDKKHKENHDGGDLPVSPIQEAMPAVKKPRVMGHKEEQPDPRSTSLPRFHLRGDMFSGASLEVLDEGLDAAQVRAVIM